MSWVQQGSDGCRMWARTITTDKNNAFSVHLILPESYEILPGFSHGNANYTCVEVDIDTCTEHTRT